MNSTSLIIAVEQWFPWVDVHEEKGSLSISGPMAEIFDFLISSLNLSYSYKTPQDGKKGGGKLRNGSYTGMIGMLHRKEADIAVGPFTANFDRFQAAEFTNPIYVDYLSILTGAPHVKNELFSYMMTFEWKVWVAIFTTIILLAVTSAIMEDVIVGKRQSFRRMYVQFLHSFWRFYRCLWHQSLQQLPEVTSKRLLLITWLLSVVVIMASFGGHIRSSLLVQLKGDHIEELKDVLRFPKIQPLLETGSSAETLLQLGAHPTYKNVWTRIAANPSSRMSFNELLSEDTLDKVEKNTHMIITEVSSLMGALAERYQKKKQCSFHLSNTFYQKNMVIAMRRDLKQEFKREIKDRIGRFYPFGVIGHKITNRTQGYRNCLWIAESVIVSSMTAEDFQGVFYLWIGGIGLASVAFIVEVITESVCCRPSI
ncbi:glutamate receptor ionotropic, kainate glr-3-like [Tachypleus tridentatus]|uniref:glutamate receptor ionotropic, kainate glr-3-like n=1 Tax=Tachypleus tridentatus TaxID=6853 RepID=UPI003FD0CE24